MCCGRSACVRIWPPFAGCSRNLRRIVRSGHSTKGVPFPSPNSTTVATRRSLAATLHWCPARNGYPRWRSLSPIRRQPCHLPLKAPLLASEACQKLRDGASPDKNPSQFSVFDVVFVGHVVRLGPANHELPHRRVTVAIPLVLNAQPVKRILEIVESAVALDRTPKLFSGFRVRQCPDESLHVTVFVELKLPRRINEPVAAVVYNRPRRFDFFLLPVGHIRQCFVLALFDGAQDTVLHADDPAGVPVKIGAPIHGLELERVRQLAQFGGWVHTATLVPPRTTCNRLPFAPIRCWMLD